MTTHIKALHLYKYTEPFKPLCCMFGTQDLTVAHTRACTCTHTHTHTRAHTRTCAHTHMDTHACTHTYTHAWTHACSNASHTCLGMHGLCFRICRTCGRAMTRGCPSTTMRASPAPWLAWWTRQATGTVVCRALVSSVGVARSAQTQTNLTVRHRTAGLPRDSPRGLGKATSFATTPLPCPCIYFGAALLWGLSGEPLQVFSGCRASRLLPLFLWGCVISHLDNEGC